MPSKSKQLSPERPAAGRRVLPLAIKSAATACGRSTGKLRRWADKVVIAP